MTLRAWAELLRAPLSTCLSRGAARGRLPGVEPLRRTPSVGGGGGRAGGGGGALRAWAELLRVSALFTVPGDALAGAAAAGLRPNRGTALAVGASLCLYEAGMALNDWADREEDAVDRPHRPIPSGRISPPAALAAAGALTAAGLTLAARAGRPSLALATALSATVWSYDLHFKHTAGGPAAMAAARGLDLLLGAVATGGPVGRGPRLGRPGPVQGSADPPQIGPHAPGREASAAGTAARKRPVTGARLAAGSATVHGSVAAAHRLGPPPAATARTVPVGAPAVGTRSGWSPDPARSGSGSSSAGGGVSPVRHAPRVVDGLGHARRGVVAALPAAAVLAAHTYAVTTVSRHEAQGGSTTAPLAALAATLGLGALVARERRGPGGWSPGAGTGGVGERLARSPGAPALTPALLLAAAYVRTAAKPLAHAALNPSPPLTQRAVGGGIRAMIPLQAALAARSGAIGTGLAVMGLVPIARTLARKVSPT